MTLWPPIAIFAVVTFVTDSIPNLESLQWHSRVLLLFAQSTRDTRLKQQRERIEADTKGFEERDLKSFALVGASAGLLRKRFHVKEDEFTVILIGKDGAEKLRSDQPLAAQRLFEVIDAMPMRRGEMNSR